RKLSERIAIPHRRLLPVERSRARKAYAVAERIYDSPIDKNLGPICRSGFWDSDKAFIHVRSSLAENGQAFCPYHPGMATRFDPSDWTHVALSKSTVDLPHREQAATYMRAEMPRFFAAVGYDALDPQSPEIMGYDAWDLVYMEHRMGTWHGPALLT